MKMRKRLTLLLAVGALGCSQVNVRGDADGGSAMDAPSPMRDVFVAPDVFAFTDVPALRDVSRLPDAVMDDVFIAPDASIPDAGMLPDAARFDASAMLDASTAGCGDLRLYFRFEETSGLVIDESGCGNHGTAFEVRRGEVGARGNAYGFGLPVSRETRVVVPDSASLRALPQLTVSAWVRAQGYSSAPVVGFVNDDGWQGFSFGVRGMFNPYVELRRGPSCLDSTLVSAERNVEMNRWTHVAVSIDSSAEVVHYMNGVEIHRIRLDRSPPLFCNEGLPLWVGAAPRLAGRLHSWNGAIDELRIWSVVRTQAEVCVDAGGVPNSLGGCAL